MRSIRSAILTAEEHDRYGIDARTLELVANPKKRLLLEAHLKATAEDPNRLREEWRLIDLGCSTGYTRTSAEGVCPTVLASHGDRDLYCTHKSVGRLLSPFEAMLIMGFDALQLRAASRALIHRSPGHVKKLMGLPEVGKLAGNAVTERSARVLLRTMIVSFPGLFLHK